MYALLIQVNLYEKDLRLNCNVRFSYLSEPIDGVTGDVNARRCSHASWEFLLFFARWCACASWFVQGPCC